MLRNRYGALSKAIQKEYKLCRISKKIKRELQAKSNEESRLVENGEAEMYTCTPKEWVYTNKDKS
jgi:predicted GIY-YIG superfamily endonuclease